MKTRIGVHLFLLVGALALLTPATYWIIVGLVRQEPFHDGKPTSYWIERLESKAKRESDGSVRLATKPDSAAEKFGTGRQPPI